MVSAHLLMFIEAEDPRIGLYCFIVIGMQEISPAEPTVKEGQWVKRGEELGTIFCRCRYRCGGARAW
ncbi:hypothetical protein DFH09DRAFT_1167581 [Mycena vulgaris]|nr:hypothetical protein DFH09DRAFT_1167581 [Mycena vulgaris]